MGWSEIIDQPGISYDTVRGFSGQRRFKVWDVPAEKIIGSPQTVKRNPVGTNAEDNDTLPAYNTAWPRGGFEINPGGDAASLAHMILNRYKVSGNGRCLDVEAEYAEQTRQFYWTSTFQTETVDVPVAKRIPITIYSDAGLPTGTASYQWNIERRPVLNTVCRMQYRCGVDITPDQNDPTPHGRAIFVERLMSKVRAQQNRLHNLGTPEVPLWGRFETCDMAYAQLNYYLVTYSWVVDSGIPWKGLDTSPVEGQPGLPTFVQPDGMPAQIWPGGTQGYADTTGLQPGAFLVPPFSRIEVVPSLVRNQWGGYLEPPTFRPAVLYMYSPNGLSLLPGLIV